MNETNEHNPDGLECCHHVISPLRARIAELERQLLIERGENEAGDRILKDQDEEITELKRRVEELTEENERLKEERDAYQGGSESSKRGENHWHGLWNLNQTEKINLRNRLKVATDSCEVLEKANIALRAEVERLTKERDEAVKHIQLSGGYHERTEREIEIGSALMDWPECDWSSEDHAISELLDLIDAGRNRVFAAESERDTLRAQLAEREEDRARLEGLVDLIQQNGDGEWEITLCYDNTGDAAAVIDSEGNIIGECGDISKSPIDQFREAIDEAIRAARAQEDGK